MLKKYKHKILYFSYLLLGVLMLRSLFVELSGDEYTYYNLAKNILSTGLYQDNGTGSTIIPSIPYLLYFTSFINGEIQIWLVRLLSSLGLITGLCFFYKYLILKNKGHLSFIIPLILINHTFLAASGSLYPDALIFMFTWIFVYFASQENFFKKRNNLFLVVISIVGLFYLRYIYLFIYPILFYYVNKKSIFSFDLKKILEPKKFYIYIIASLSVIIPWLLYMVGVETGEEVKSHSYLSRFSNGFLRTLSDGIGITIRENHSRHNGVPAFISLFIPVTGIRSWIISIALILFVVFTFYKKRFFKENEMASLFFISLYILLVLAGTGFSRYWLSSLPLIYLAIANYLVTKFDKKIIEKVTYTLTLIFFINQLRLTYLIIS